MSLYGRLILTLLLTATTVPLKAEIKFSALTTIGYTGGADRQSKINTMFRGDDPFNPIRVTIFAESWINPRLGVFTEFLWDQGKYMNGSDTKPRVNGAYVVAKATANSDALIFKLGMIPSTFGTWAPRTYADRNPLVGLPLMYHYRTPISNTTLMRTPDQVLARRELDAYGLPIVYDACWDNGIEALGFSPGGKFEWHLAVSKAAMSSPSSFLNSGAQLIGRVGFQPVVGLKFGFSAERGSYLADSAGYLAPGISIASVHQKALGLDLQYSVAHTEFHSEMIRNWWENPNLEHDQQVTSGYVELKQTLFPGLFAAARMDRLYYNRFTDSSGRFFTWGYNVSQVESGVGYYITRGALAKAVWQHTRLVDENDVDLINVQLVLTF